MGLVKLTEDARNALMRDVAVVYHNPALKKDEAAFMAAIDAAMVKFHAAVKPVDDFIEKTLKKAVADEGAEAKTLLIKAHDEALKIIHLAHDEAEKLISLFGARAPGPPAPATEPAKAEAPPAGASEK